MYSVIFNGTRIIDYEVAVKDTYIVIVAGKFSGSYSRIIDFWNKLDKQNDNKTKQ